ncbi:MAG: M20/M25/M40 family metallo-hydrolase [Halovenus sp.]
MSGVHELTRALVAIPSHTDETAAGDHIEQWLRAETDSRVERDSHGSVIARKGGGDRSLALVGHHDVVPPDSSQTADGEYVLETREGRLYGRGAADMKGAVAASLCAFRDCVPENSELVFASFVGEETGGQGARGAISDGFAPTHAVVGEGSTGYSAPGVTDVAIAHKGRRAITVAAEGTPAHASQPEAGTNAIYRATDAVDAIRELPVPETTVLGHELRGSVVVTEIEGGSAWNVVPEHCSVTVDERTVPGERAPVRGLAEQSGLSVSVDQDLKPMACADGDFADLALDAARESQRPDSDPAGHRQSTDGTPEHVVKPHATDAGWLAEAGTACVVCGPAEPGEAHTADESVSLSVLDRCYEIYREIGARYDSASAG